MSMLWVKIVEVGEKLNEWGDRVCVGRELDLTEPDTVQEFMTVADWRDRCVSSRSLMNRKRAVWLLSLMGGVDIDRNPAAWQPQKVKEVREHVDAMEKQGLFNSKAVVKVDGRTVKVLTVVSLEVGDLVLVQPTEAADWFADSRNEEFLATRKQLQEMDEADGPCTLASRTVVLHDTPTDPSGKLESGDKGFGAVVSKWLHGSAGSVARSVDADGSLHLFTDRGRPWLPAAAADLRRRKYQVQLADTTIDISYEADAKMKEHNADPAKVEAEVMTYEKAASLWPVKYSEETPSAGQDQQPPTV